DRVVAPDGARRPDRRRGRGARPGHLRRARRRDGIGMSAAQLERLQEQLQRLRLFKGRERLEALLPDATVKEATYADFLELEPACHAFGFPRPPRCSSRIWRTTSASTISTSAVGGATIAVSLAIVLLSTSRRGWSDSDSDGASFLLSPYRN